MIACYSLVPNRCVASLIECVMTSDVDGILFRCIFNGVGNGKYRTLASRSEGNTKSTSWLLNHEALTELD